MGQYIEVLIYKGKALIYLNMEGLDEEKQLKAIEEADRVFSLKNNILNITNVEKTTTPAVKDRANALNENHHDRIKGQAVIGVSGVKRFLAQGMNKDIHFAKSIDEAKEWLIQQ